MDPITARLTTCFRTVFPDLPEDRIATASQASVSAWDSTAAILLANVIEEEFAIELDFDVLAELDSFPRIHEYLSKEKIPG